MSKLELDRLGLYMLWRLKKERLMPLWQWIYELQYEPFFPKRVLFKTYAGSLVDVKTSITVTLRKSSVKMEIFVRFLELLIHEAVENTLARCH